MKIFTPVCSLGLILLCTACTNTNSGEDALAATEPGAERVCRGTKTSGSRMAIQTCKTANEWAMLDAQEAEKEALQDEFFRRVGDGSTLQQGPAFDSPTGAGF